MSLRSTIALSCLIPASAMALPCAPGGAFINNLREVGLKPLEVVIVDEAERKDAPAYARAHNKTKAEIEAQYAATGDIECPLGKSRSLGQGQVTVKNNTVVSVAHVFQGDDDSCKAAIAPEKCKFTIRVEGKSQTYGIEKATDTGWPCPSKGERGLGTDWIVLKLKKPVDARVKPYAIPNQPRSKIRADQDVVTVAKSDDWPPGARGADTNARPRHYGDCRIRNVSKVTTTEELIQTDCDLSSGASGGSMLTPGPNPTLVGVLMGQQQVGVHGKNCDPSLGKNGRDTYHENCWANYAIPVSSELWTAIAVATDFSSAPEAAPPVTTETPRQNAPAPQRRPDPSPPAEPGPNESGPNRRHDVPGGGYYRNF